MIDSSVDVRPPGWLSVTPSAVGPCLVLAMEGEADMVTADHLRDQLRVAIGSDHRSMILDVSGLAFCSLHGLDALHDAIETAEQAGIDVTMHGMSPQLAWLHRAFPTYHPSAGRPDRPPGGSSHLRCLDQPPAPLRPAAPVGQFRD